MSETLLTLTQFQRDVMPHRSKAFIRREVKAGRLPAAVIGKNRLMLRPSDGERYIDTRFESRQATVDRWLSMSREAMDCRRRYIECLGDLIDARMEYSSLRDKAVKLMDLLREEREVNGVLTARLDVFERFYLGGRR
jgi:hypothetical protein